MSRINGSRRDMMSWLAACRDQQRARVPLSEERRPVLDAAMSDRSVAQIVNRYVELVGLDPASFA
jgi:hypothetical protein